MPWILRGNIQGPAGSGGSSNILAKALADDFAFGTSLTAITPLDITLTPGTWLIRCQGAWATTGTASNVTTQMRFNGTASKAQFQYHRIAASAIVGVTNQALNVNTSATTTTPMQFLFDGVIVVTAQGTFGLSATRAASTSGVILRGATLTVFQV